MKLKIEKSGKKQSSTMSVADSVFAADFNEPLGVAIDSNNRIIVLHRAGFDGFQIYDSSEDIVYDALASEDIAWSSFGLNLLEFVNVFPDCNGDLGGSVGDEDGDSVCDDVDVCPGYDDYLDVDGNGVPDDCEVYGCMDNIATNYDLDATQDDGSCYYTYSGSDDENIYAEGLNYHVGANLVSYYVLPDVSGYYPESSLQNFDFFNPELISAILGENAAASFDDNGNLMGSLQYIERDKGYWIKLLSDYNAEVTGFRTDSDINYQLHAGNNLISFPSDANYNLETVLPDELDGLVYGILGEGEFALYVNGEWVGSLAVNGLQGFKGYWFRTNEAVDFSFNLSQDNALAINSDKKMRNQSLAGYEYVQSSSQAGYFVKDIPEAQIGDYIIAYHGDMVIGQRRWDGEMVDIPVMGYDGSSYSEGYIDQGDTPTFKLYKTTGEEIDLYGSIPGFSPNEIFEMDILTTEPAIPSQVTLKGAYPNPFNPTTTIEFSLPYSMHVELNVLDIQGRLVKNVVSGSYSKGDNKIQVDGNDLASGLYFVQLLTNSHPHYTKILLLK